MVTKSNMPGGHIRVNRCHHFLAEIVRRLVGRGHRCSSAEQEHRSLNISVQIERAARPPHRCFDRLERADSAELHQLAPSVDKSARSFFVPISSPRVCRADPGPVPAPWGIGSGLADWVLERATMGASHTSSAISIEFMGTNRVSNRSVMFGHSTCSTSKQFRRGFGLN